MRIDNKYIGIIITSLQYSIKNIREWHEKENLRTKGEWRKVYDWEEFSVKPVQDVLIAIQETIKSTKK